MSTADVAHQAAENKTSAADVGGSAVRWDRFLPKMAVRVLLVEADDSTRQIITALLRKCSYRVAAVGDGLKAWELLKGRPNAIDLILTEVELPLISGYALLTLIMEHDICKNIPVIMMSTNDSVSMVYKCMLRGAVDFLVKPVRKNELRNLWQHVWRKQASNSAAAAAGGGPGPPDESVAQQKFEATAENNEASNQSSGFIACVQRNRECIEKGSDAQSSCTKPELDFDEDDMAADDMIISDDANSTRRALGRESRETPGEGREAIDLIGAFDANNNSSKGVHESPPSNDSTNGFDISRRLDLSLRRSQPINDENRRLNHSIASAFSRYVSRPFIPGNSTSPSAQKTDQETDLSNRATDYNSDISQPIAVRGLKLEHVINGYGSLAHEMYRSPLPSKRTPNTPKLFPRGGKLYRIMDISANNECVEGGNERGFSNTNNIQEEPSPRSNNRSMQREAALTKFRLKRKDRCFEKKVRYESRKKLAEQRPRVKGQFVRQVPDETQPGNSSAG